MKNTNINRPEISSEEINSGKNFDKLYSSYVKTTKPFFKQNWFIANSILVIGIVAAVIYFNNDEPKTSELDEKPVAIESNQTAENLDKEEVSSPFVNPPIEGLNVPFTSYTVLSNKAKIIEHTSGSFIKIPNNAFVDENGNLVKGEVEIKYREFKDVAEIFASGIPMTYEQGSEEFHFESAGMMEILAYQDGKAVYINPKKKIDIEMTSEYASTKYNLYSLDTANKRWVDEGKDKVIKREERTASNNEEPVPDTLSVFEEFFGPYTGGIATTPEKNPDLKIIKDEIVEIQKDIKKIQETKPEAPVEATEKRFRFNLDVDKNEFPEMSIYQGLEFEIGKENKGFDPKLTNKEWHDIALSKNEQGKFILTLKRYYTNKEAKSNLDKNSESNMDIKKFIVYPVYEGQNFTDAMANFNQKFELYSTKLNKRKEDERIKKEEYEKKLAEFKAENERRQKEWKEAQKYASQVAQTNGQIYRAFSIMKLGTYNCDNPIKLPEGQTVLASFYDKEQNKLKISKVYLIEKNKNAVFAYYPAYIDKFKFNPKSKNIIIGVTTDNKFITFSTEQFKAIPTTAEVYDFEMKVEPTTVNSIKELKKCISFL